MAWNHATAKNKKDAEFRRIANICRTEGMTEDGIEKINEMLHDEMNSDRRYYDHVKSCGDLECFDDIQDNPLSSLLAKVLKQVSTTQSDISESIETHWIDDMDTPKISVWVKSLSEKDIELLTLVMSGMRQKEIAKIWEVSDATISKRMSKIRKHLTSILPEKIKQHYGV